MTNKALGDAMVENRNNVSKTYTDPQTGKFAQGNPGRPRGARHKTSLAVESLLEGEAGELTQKALELAKAGDIAALKLCMDRIAPRRKDAPITFELPSVKGAKDAANAIPSVLSAVSQGQLTPNEASIVVSMLERCARMFQLAEFEDRISAIERAVLGPQK
jgi:hypothetical protein